MHLGRIRLSSSSKLLSAAIFFCLFFLATSLQAQTVISNKIIWGDTTQVHVLHTQRGDKIVGRAIGISGTELSFEMSSNRQIIPFALGEVAFLGLQGERPAGEPAPPVTKVAVREQVQYMGGEDLFVVPTGFLPERNTIYRNTMVFYNQVDFAFGKHVSVGTGLVLPIIMNFRAKAVFELKPFLRVGVTAQQVNSLIPDILNLSSFSGILTMGQRDRFLNLSLGRVYLWSNDDRAGLVSLGGSYRINSRSRIYGDLMHYAGSVDSGFIPSLMYSRMGGRNRFDMGLMALPLSATDFFVPIPVFSYFRLL